MKTFNFSVLVVLFLLVSCAKESAIDIDQPITSEPFTEGTIEMGMSSHGVDLGVLIKNIDFSRDDVREQFVALTENHEEAQQFLTLMEEYAQANPVIGLALMLNGVIATYYVKGDAVLGRARGLGYLFDNYHNSVEDQGQIYVRTLVQLDEIPEEDRELSITYTPSEDLGVGSGGSISTSMYDRQVASKKQVVAGYACEVSTYTLKSEFDVDPDFDPDFPMPTSARLHKLVVYTSDAFNKTINFTHPFYLPEDNGILKLEIHFDKLDEPTLVMQPDNITPRTVAPAEMQIEEKLPVYDYNNLTVAWKIFAIMMSGWGALGDDTN